MNDIKPEYIDTDLAAYLLGISVTTLKRWRKSGVGPPFVKMEKRLVRYSISELRDWAKNNQRRINKPYGLY